MRITYKNNESREKERRKGKIMDSNQSERKEDSFRCETNRREEEKRVRRLMEFRIF